MDQKLLDGLMDAVFPEGESAIYYKGLIYGPDGVGKTVSACSIGEKVLYLAVDPAGYTSLYNHPELGWRTRIIPMAYKGLSQLEALADAFTEGIPQFAEFDTLVVDTASNTQVLDTDKVTKARIQKKKNTPKEFDFQDDMYGVYNQSTLQLRTAYLKLLLAPVNVVLVAHDRRWEDKEGTGLKYIQPKFTPEFYKSISSYCRQVIYMTATPQVNKADNSVKYTRTMQFHPSGNIVAKSNIGGLPLKQNNPNLRQIVENWQKLGGQLIPEHLATEPLVEKEEELADFDLEMQ
jgi:hypothetical protein